MKPLVKIRAIFAAISLAVPMLAMANAPASATNLAEIPSRGSVRIGVLTGAPPMGMVDESGNPSGYDVDVANLIAGYFVAGRTRAVDPAARIPALQTGKVDFLVATLAPTGERAKTVMFTQPYSAFNMDIISGPDQKFAELPNLKASVWRSIAARRRKRRCARRQCQASKSSFSRTIPPARRHSSPVRSMPPRCPRRSPKRSSAAAGRRSAGRLHLFPARQLHGDEAGRISSCASGSTRRYI